MEDSHPEIWTMEQMVSGESSPPLKRYGIIPPAQKAIPNRRK